MQDSGAVQLKGHFLIAMPSMADPNFSETVTCICEHNENGAIGVVINRLYPSLTCGEIFAELRITAQAAASHIGIYAGGPVHANEIFILHGEPAGWESCFAVNPGLFMSNSIDILKAMAAGRGPDAVLVALGCAGWGPGQLEREIAANAWLTCPADAEIIFQTAVEKRWRAAVWKMGIDPALLADTAGHA